IHPVHQPLAFKRADGRLVRYDQKDSHGAIWRSERLLLFNHGAFCKQLERRRNQPERIERKLELRPRRAGLDLLTQALKTIANFLRLQDRHRLVESMRFQIEEQRDRDCLESANAFGRGHGRTREYARAPWLLT